MAFEVPSFPDPRDTDHPLVDAYAWLASLSLDLASGQGQIVLNVHPHAAAWRDTPVDQLGIALGQVLGPGPEGGPPATFPTLGELMADPEFAAAYQVIGAKLYAAAAAHPALAGAVTV